MINFHFPVLIDKSVEVFSSPTFVGSSVLAFITVTDLENILKVLLLIITIGYSSWKWNTERNEKKKK